MRCRVLAQMSAAEQIVAAEREPANLSSTTGLSPGFRARPLNSIVGCFAITQMKNLAIRFVFLLLPLTVFAGNVNAEPWRGIVPLKSTRSDVERLLGKPLPGNMNFYVTYKLESEE